MFVLSSGQCQYPQLVFAAAFLLGSCPEGWPAQLLPGEPVVCLTSTSEATFLPRSLSEPFHTRERTLEVQRPPYSKALSG